MLRRAARWSGLSALLGVVASVASAHACPPVYTSETVRVLGVAPDGTSVVIETGESLVTFDYKLTVRDATGGRKSRLRAVLERHTETNSNDRAPTIDGDPATSADLAKLARGMKISSFDTYAAAPFEAAVMQRFHLAPPSATHAPGEVLEPVEPPDDTDATTEAIEVLEPAPAASDEPSGPVKTDAPLAARPAPSGLDPLSVMLGALAVASYVLAYRRGFRARR